MDSDKNRGDRPLTRLLNDVHGDACKPQTRAPWHFGTSLDLYLDTSDTTRLSGRNVPSAASTCTCGLKFVCLPP